jgi:outer membrane protein TolC
VIALALLLSAGLTLREVQERARVTDPRVAQAQAQLLNAQGKKEEADYAWFPSITATGYLGGPTPERYLKGGGALNPNPTAPDAVWHNSFWDGQLGVQMHADVQAILPLYTFGKIASGQEATKHLVGANQALVQRAKDQTTFDAARAYWGYQTARDAGNTVEKIRGELNEAKATADRLLKEDSDQISQADRLKIDYLAEQFEAFQAGTLKNRELAVFGMRALLGLKADDPLDIAQESLPEPPAQPPMEKIVKLALERRPEMIAAEEAVRARKALVDLENARLFPDFGLVGGAIWTETTNASSPVSPFAYNPYHDLSAYVALAVRGSFEIPQKLARRSQAEADLAEAMAVRAGAERLVRLDVQQALGDLAEARVKVDRFTRQTAIGKLLLTRATLAFDSGLGEARELMEDTLLYAYADGARLGALFDAQVAWAALERATSGPLQ